MSRGRKPHTDPPIPLKIYLPKSMVEELDLMMYDPLRGKPTYGMRSQFIQNLVRQWFNNLRSKNDLRPSQADSTQTP